MFVACDGFGEGLAVCEAAEMEGCAPAIFVEIRGEIVVAKERFG
jgi:hypothetical protein